MARATWRGELAFGLVTIPIALYPAAVRSSEAPKFTLIHKSCGARIKMARRCSGCDQDVAPEDLARGVPVEGGRYAVFTKEELSSLGESMDSVGIVEFIRAGQVDPSLLTISFWVAPSGKSWRGFSLMAKAMKQSGSCAICRVGARNKNELGLLRPREDLLALDILRPGTDVRSCDSLPSADGEHSEREMRLAINLISALSVDVFDHSKHPDLYREAIFAAVREKEQAGETVRQRDSSNKNVIYMADLLEKSVQTAKTRRP